MSKFLNTFYVSPNEIPNILVSANFSEAGENEAGALVENEGKQAANLVNILKPEVLSDDKAIKEISEATDVDPSVIKGLADTKGEAIDVAEEEGASKEQAEEYYFSLVAQRLPALLEESVDRYGTRACFSDSVSENGTSDINEDTVEAIKLVKYVDDAAIEEDGPSGVAEIISEATDGDKSIIEEVIEVKKDAMDEVKHVERVAFSELMQEALERASQAATERSDNAIVELMSALKSIQEDQEQRIASGENVVKRTIQTQDGSDIQPTETDKLAAENIPDNIGQKLVMETKSSYNLPNIEKPAGSTAQSDPVVMFSSKYYNDHMKQASSEGKIVKYNMPGAPDSIVELTQNFSKDDDVYDNAVQNILKSVSECCRRNVVY